MSLLSIGNHGDYLRTGGEYGLPDGLVILTPSPTKRVSIAGESLPAGITTTFLLSHGGFVAAEVRILDQVSKRALFPPIALDADSFEATCEAIVADVRNGTATVVPPEVLTWLRNASVYQNRTDRFFAGLARMSFHLQRGAGLVRLV